MRNKKKVKNCSHNQDTLHLFSFIKLCEKRQQQQKSSVSNNNKNNNVKKPKNAREIHIFQNVSDGFLHFFWFQRKLVFLPIARFDGWVSPLNFD